MGNIIRYGNSGIAKFGRSGNEGRTLAFYLNDSGTWEAIPFSHIRGSNAFEENNGVLTEVGIDVPRFQGGKYFTEGESENLEVDNTDLSSWTSGTQYVTSDFAPSYIDGRLADRVLFTSANQDLYDYTNGFIGDNHSYSTVIKGIAGETIQLGLSGYVFVHTFTGGWDKVKSENKTTTSLLISFNNFGGATARDFLVSYVQVEKSSVSTSFTPTTRQADTGIQSLVDLSEQINSEALTFEIGKAFLNNSFRTGDTNNVSDNTTSNKVEVYKSTTTDNEVSFNVVRGGVSVASYQYNYADMTVNTIFKIVTGNNVSDGGAYVDNVRIADWSGLDTSFSSGTLNTIQLENTGLTDFIKVTPNE